jgi:alkanesulfonate monooxygenase SsuD/methylene tetrahydromethanopterin reductase-like flavin-dependent oxidoreductase (luciferase family)
MHIGVVLNMTYRTPPITDCAIALEERGFESMWLGQHTHLPVDSVCRYGKGSYSCGAEARDGYVPEFYKRVPDPYPSLAAAAARTERLRIGTCIALPGEHHPTAKTIATLDHMSGGRFLFRCWLRLEPAGNAEQRVHHRGSSCSHAREDRGHEGVVDPRHGLL